MADLGKGTRVFVGWACNYPPEIAHTLCETGTIIDGPYPPQAPSLVKTWINETWWLVDSDAGKNIEAAERILFPIDPDDEKDTERDKQLETT